MKDLSMHILDIVQNSITAKATEIYIGVEELIDENKLNIIINDNGIGMDEKFLIEIKNPFKTSRTTRRVGLGIPLLEQTCTISNGYLKISSEKNKGTKIFGTMDYDNIDRPPVGNIVDTIYILIITNENINIIYNHKFNKKEFQFDTKEVRNILEGISFSEPEIMSWIKSNLLDGILEIRKNL